MVNVATDKIFDGYDLEFATQKVAFRMPFRASAERRSTVNISAARGGHVRIAGPEISDVRPGRTG